MAVAAASEAVREKVDNHFNLLDFLVARQRRRAIKLNKAWIFLVAEFQLRGRRLDSHGGPRPSGALSNALPKQRATSVGNVGAAS